MTGRSLPRHTLIAAVATAFVASACTRSDDAPANAASPAQQAPAAQTNAGNAATGEAAITAFLGSAYGPNATLAGEWTQAPYDRALLAEGGEQDGAVTRRVCEHERTQYDGKPAVLLAVCGALKDFGHPTPGITDFFLLQGEPLAEVARAHLQRFGSMGNAGDVDSERFGANLPGFIVESGFTGQGHTTINRSLLLPKGSAFVEAATFLSGMDDDVLREGCDDEAASCPPGQAYDIEFDLDVDDTDPAAAAYPLLVQERGDACGKPADARYTLSLDAATLTYNVPAALRRELPCETAAR